MNAGATPAGTAVAKLLADRLTPAGQQAPRAVAPIDRADANSSPRVSSRMDEEDKTRVGRRARPPTLLQLVQPGSGRLFAGVPRTER